jgi:hypothetical protein
MPASKLWLPQVLLLHSKENCKENWFGKTKCTTNFTNSFYNLPLKGLLQFIGESPFVHRANS